MPIYDFKCDSCGREAEFSMTVREYESLDTNPTCFCGKILIRKLRSVNKVVYGTRKGQYNSTQDLKPPK